MGRWSELLAPKFLALDWYSGWRPGSRRCLRDRRLSKALADSGHNVVGIDVSEGFLEGARQLRSHPNITYQTGDIRKMTFPDGAFDAAVSTLALDVLPETDQVVAEMKRVVRPGGVVASAVHQFLGGLPANDLLIHTASVFDADIRELRSIRAGRQRFWPGGQAVMWRATDSWMWWKLHSSSTASIHRSETFGKPSPVAWPASRRVLWRCLMTFAARSSEHVRDGYLLGWPDGPRSFPMIARAVRGNVPG